MRILLIVASAALLSGCLTMGGGREVRSAPSGALVTIAGFGECTTPCKLKLDKKRRIQIAKAGYVTRYVDVEPDGDAITIPLDLAAPTEDVDTETLPDLD